MITFALAVFLLIITPGPGVLSVAGVGTSHGRAAGLSYLAGLGIGNAAVALIVATGLSAAVLAHDGLRLVLTVLSFAYLSYLAFRIATAGAHIGFIQSAKAPGLRDGIALQFINPKAYAVNTALFSGFNFLPASYPMEVAVKLVLLNLIWIPIHLGWLWAGLTLRRLDLPARWQRRINYAMAACLMMVVLIAIYAQWRGA